MRVMWRGMKKARGGWAGRSVPLSRRWVMREVAARQGRLPLLLVLVKRFSFA